MALKNGVAYILLFLCMACITGQTSEKNKVEPPQYITVPLEWQGDMESLNMLSLKKIENPPEPSENEKKGFSHYQAIMKLLSSHKNEEILASCRDFLQKYPDSVLRYRVLQIVKSITKKDMQLYALENWIVMPNQIPALLLTGRNVENIKMEVWKVNLRRVIEECEDIHFPITSRYSQKVREWTEKSDPKIPIFYRRLVLEALPSGCYVILAQEKDVRTEVVILVSSICMLVKHTENLFLVWTGRRDGLPMKSEGNIFLIQNQRPVYEDKIGQEGLWIKRVKEPISPITWVAFYGEDIAICDSHWYLYERALQKGYIYLDRPIYMSGNAIHAKIFLRSFDPKTQGYYYQMEPLVYASIQDQEWKQWVSQPLAVSDLATASIRYVVPEKAPTGRYCFRVRSWCMGETYFPVVSGTDAKTQVLEKHIHSEDKASSAKHSLTPDSLQNKSENQTPPGERNKTPGEGNKTASGVGNQAASGNPGNQTAESKDKKNERSEMIVDKKPTLSLEMDKTHYEHGETIAISLKQEFSTSPVLLTYEGNGIVGYTLIRENFLQAKDTRTALNEFSPGIKLIATRFEPDKLVMKEKWISIPAKHKMLKISLRTDKESYHSQDMVNLSMDVQDSEGHPIQAELMVSVVPDAVMSMVPETVYSKEQGIFDFYYDQRYTEIPLFHSFQFEFINDRESSLLSLTQTKPEIENIDSPKKEEKRNGIPFSSIPDESYWNANLKTDARGKATESFPMFKTKTAWRITVLGIDKETRAGQAYLIIHCE